MLPDITSSRPPARSPPEGSNMREIAPIAPLDPTMPMFISAIRLA